MEKILTHVYETPSLRTFAVGVRRCIALSPTSTENYGYNRYGSGSSTDGYYRETDD